MGTVEKAICLLTDYCDGAVEHDGKGWNKFDSPIGRSFAEQIRSGRKLTFKQRRTINKIIRKYRRQIPNWEEVEAALPSWVKEGEEAYKKEPLRIKAQEELLPSLDFKDNYFYIKTSYKGRELAKQIPHRRWIAEDKVWRYLNTDAVKSELVQLVQSGNFKSISKEANDLLFSHSVKLLEKEQKKQEAREIKNQSTVDLNIPLKTTMFDHQKKAAKIGITLDNTALLMEQGTGKTLSAIAVATYRYLKGQVKRILIVAPKSVLPEWSRQFGEHTDIPYEVRSLEGLKKQKKVEAIQNWEGVEGLQGIVINYESVWRLEKELIKWKPDMIIADESQKIKRHGSKQSKSMHKLGKVAKYRMILTGTPVTQSPLDFFSQYKFLQPDLFGENFRKFRDRYAIMGGYQGYQVVGYQNLEELADKAHSIAYRVTKDEALDLPEIVHQNLYAELEPAAMRQYKQLAKESILKLGSETVTAPIVLTQLMRLQQITGGFIKTEEDNVVQISKAKLGVLKDKLEDIMEAGKKVVIFARFISEIEAISDILNELNVKHHTLTGQTKDRGELINDFQNNPETRAFVINPKTGGTGITLTAADTAIFYSKDYSLETYLQALARIHRIGQERKVTILHIVAQGTVDEAITERLKEKKDLADLVVDDFKNIIFPKEEKEMSKNKLEEKLESLKRAIEEGEEITNKAIEELDELDQEEVAEEKPAKKKKHKKKAAGDVTEKKEEKPAKKKAEKEGDGTPKVTVGDLAEELDISPTALRKYLRDKEFEKPTGGRWEWPEGHPDLEKIRALKDE